MSAAYCSSCGAELRAGAKFCSECGTEAPAAGSGGAGTEPSTRVEAGARETKTDDTPSNTMFRVTSGLVAGYFVFVVLGAAVSSNALVGLGVICVPISLITMYVDLRDLEEPLWDTRPILWVIGALLLYIVVGPLYIYKRRQEA